ncbi:hypothetical protein [Halovenus halobia]|uniref:hypothetical protein n=1 Tax=Halovenus halobia TaxID=3396622 RepID=UPI003F55498E
MCPPPPEPTAGSTGPPDRQTLRLLEDQLASDPLVVETRFEPDPYEPRLLQVELNTQRYPDSVTTVRVDIRWFTTGNFSMHYVEQRTDDSIWECRWDRHPNPHNARTHFHEPPTGAEVTDLDLPSLHPLEVYSTVFSAIEQRIESLW